MLYSKQEGYIHYGVGGGRVCYSCLSAARLLGLKLFQLPGSSLVFCTVSLIVGQGSWKHHPETLKGCQVLGLDCAEAFQYISEKGSQLCSKDPTLSTNSAGITRKSPFIPIFQVEKLDAGAEPRSCPWLPECKALTKLSTSLKALNALTHGRPGLGGRCGADRSSLPVLGPPKHRNPGGHWGSQHPRAHRPQPGQHQTARLLGEDSKHETKNEHLSTLLRSI